MTTTPASLTPNLRQLPHHSYTLPAPTFNDNVCVRNGRQSCEFLSISLAPAEEHMPYEVTIRRYQTPGRFDTYSFDCSRAQHFGYGDHLRYHSEQMGSIAHALKLAAEDFDKPQVVRLVVNAFSANRILATYGRDFDTLLSCVAPKSRAYRAFKRLRTKWVKERDARIVAARAARGEAARATAQT